MLYNGGFIVIIIFFIIGSLITDDASKGAIIFWVIMAFICSVVTLFLDSKSNNDFSNSLMLRMKEVLNKVDNFSPTQELYSADRESMIAVDEERKKENSIN